MEEALIENKDRFGLYVRKIFDISRGKNCRHYITFLFQTINSSLEVRNSELKSIHGYPHLKNSEY